MATSLLDQPFEAYFKEYQIDTNFFPLTHLEFPVALLLFYIVTVAYFQPSKEAVAASKSHKKDSTFIQKLVISVHNLLLCIFSVLCFYNTGPVFYDMLVNIGWRKASCGLLQDEYSSNYGYWAFLFYLSKYYEFLDTYIVIWKGRRPIFLQTFHHVGAVIGLWLIVTTKSTPGSVFVVENSFIHSIMYLYYAVSCWKIKIPCKFIITLLQMLQFIIGISFGIVQLVFFAECLSIGDKIVLYYHEVYVVALFVLFRQFYNKTYTKKKSTKKKES